MYRFASAGHAILWNVRAIEATGMVFGRLTAIKRIGSRHTHAVWRCRCVCGNMHTAEMNHLRYGSVQSCGCLPGDSCRRRFTTHGMARRGACSSEYRIWANIKRRHPHPPVSVPWRAKFVTFYQDAGVRPPGAHLLRRNPRRGHSKANSYWGRPPKPWSA